MIYNIFKNYVANSPTYYLLRLIIAISFILLISYILYKMTDQKIWLNRLILIVLILIFIVIALFWVRITPRTQLSDFGNFWYRAPDVLKGQKLYAFDNDYFAKWAYQTGFMAYVMLVIKIFGYHIIAIQYLNVFYQVLTLIMVYKLSTMIFHSIKIARISVFLLLIDLDWFALNSQADNQYLGSLLFLVTFYLILKDKYWSYILGGFTLGFGAIIRPIGPVIIAGIIVFAVFFKIIRQHSFNIHSLWRLLIILGIYFAIFNFAGLLIKSSGLNQYGLSNRDTSWKFVTGLNYESSGTYDQNLVNQFDLNESRLKENTKEKTVIRQHISNLNHGDKWLELFKQKISILWSERINAIDFTEINKKISNTHYDKITLIGYLGSVAIILFSWIGSFALLKSDHTDGIFLLLLPLLAFVVIQLFIEVQGRYRIEFVPILAIISGLGVYSIFNSIKLIGGKIHAKQH